MKQALDRGDVAAASREFVRHFRGKEIVSAVLQDWPKIPRNPGHRDELTQHAERALEGHLHDGYTVYDVPSTGVDWHEAPLSCLTRFPILSRMVPTFHHTGDPRYVRYMVNHCFEYMKEWPIQTFIGHNTHEGWRTHYVVASPWYWCMLPVRLDVWAAAVHLIRRRPEVTDEELLTMLHRILEETRFLVPQIQEHMNHNAGAFMIRVLGVLCAVLDDFAEAKAWRVYDAKLLAQHLETGFYPDGLYKELTMAYSSSVVLQISQIACALLDQPAIQAKREWFDAMLTALIALVKPNGDLPSFGDLFATKVGECLFPPMVRWLDLACARPFLGETGPKPAFTAWPTVGQPAYGGYYMMRSDWSPQALYMVVDGGPWGRGHQHCDKLSFVLSAFGEDFITDPCTTTYASNEPGAWISMLNAGFLHNTITVDGVDEFFHLTGFLETEKPLDNVWEHTAEYTLFAGEFDFRPLKPVRWKRRILFVPTFGWLLQDVLTGELETAQIEQNFQFDDKIQVALDGAIAVATAPSGARLLVQPLEGSLAPQITMGDKTSRPTRSTTHSTLRSVDFGHGRGWIARCGNHPIPAPAVTYGGQVRLPAIFTMALIPLAPGVSEGAIPEIRREVSGGITRWHLRSSGGVRVLATSTERFDVVGDPRP
ncbi:MAG: alginate lyase family protein [Planctomycetes bacterium]|nr:alginate lyase family protein [Planctomycetota bacterium]